MKKHATRKLSFSWTTFLKTFGAFLPTIWIPLIINWTGQYIGLVRINSGVKEITIFGWIVTILVFGIVFWKLYAGISSSDINTLKKDNEILEQNNKILDDIIARMIHISVKKYERYMNFIENNKSKINLENAISCINPREQIKVILEDISITFYLLTRELLMRQQDIVVTLAYNINNNWQWIEGSSAQGGLTLAELISDSQTTLSHLINGRSSFIFHADKFTAAENNEYKFDEKDEDNLRIGSIVCKKLNCGNNINAILSISTYGHKMVDEDADLNKTRETIKNILVPFEKKIMEEFTILHIKDQIDSQLQI